MKRSLLITVLLLAIVGLATAQDVYSGGAIYLDRGNWVPCVYKNGTVIDEGHNTLIPEDDDHVYDPQSYWKRYGLVDWGPAKDAVVVPPHEYCVYDGVLISTTGTDPDDFTEVWHQTEASNEWRSIFVDISEYKGNDVYVAFRHQGIDSDRWFIDAVRVIAEDAPSGIAETSASTLSVYPNPANDIVRIEGLDNDVEVNVYNSIGALVKTVETVDGNVNVDDLPCGLYLLRCVNQALRFVKH